VSILALLSDHRGTTQVTPSLRAPPPPPPLPPSSSPLLLAHSHSLSLSLTLSLSHSLALSLSLSLSLSLTYTLTHFYPSLDSPCPRDSEARSPLSLSLSLSLSLVTLPTCALACAASDRLSPPSHRLAHVKARGRLGKNPTSGRAERHSWRREERPRSDAPGRVACTEWCVVIKYISKGIEAAGCRAPRRRQPVSSAPT
jgi:hypothetical protein